MVSLPCLQYIFSRRCSLLWFPTAALCQHLCFKENREMSDGGGSSYGFEGDTGKVWSPYCTSSIPRGKEGAPPTPKDLLCPRKRHRQKKWPTKGRKTPGSAVTWGTSSIPPPSPSFLLNAFSSEFSICFLFLLNFLICFCLSILHESSCC